MPTVEDWNRRYADATLPPPEAAWVLREHAHLLPARGEALDLACGRGGSALFLARHGLTVHAWDSAAVAIEALRAHAAEEGLNLHAEVRDVIAAPPEAERFDLIVVSHFLHRALFPDLFAALRPGGLLFYQTFTAAHPEKVPTLSNPAYVLHANELLRLCSPLHLVFYREEGAQAPANHPLAARAALIGRKP